MGAMVDSAMRTIHHDVAIIGGGLVGTWTAYFLRGRGRSVAVIEQGAVGSQASGVNFGNVRLQGRHPVEFPLALRAHEQWEQIERLIGEQCEFTPCGHAYIALEHKELPRLERYHAEGTAAGLEIELIGANELRRRFPWLGPDVCGATWSRRDGTANPRLATPAVARAARARGAEIFPHTRVTALEAVGERFRVTTDRDLVVEAPLVVNAAGAWARRVCQMAGVDVPLGTWSHDVMFVARPPDLRLPLPTVIDFPNSMYFRPEGGLTLVGLEDGNPLDEDPNGDSDHARAGFVDRAIDRLCKRVPLMERGGLHSAHGGYDGITPDQHPALGPIGPEGFWLDCGFSGTGFKISPATGLAMSEWILDGAPKTVDISLFTPTRFEKGIHLVSEHPYEAIWR